MYCVCSTMGKNHKRPWLFLIIWHFCLFPVKGLDHMLLETILNDIDTRSVLLISDESLEKAPQNLIGEVYFQGVIFDPTAANILVSQPLESRTLIVLEHTEFDESLQVLAASNQHNLIASTWIVITQSPLDQITPKLTSLQQQKELSPMSNIFILEKCNQQLCDPTIHQILGRIKDPPIIRVLSLKCIYCFI